MSRWPSRATRPWTQTLDVRAGAEATLALTAANADAGPVTAPSEMPGARPVDNADVRTLWQGSVVSLWTSTAQATGFVVDPRGLVATSQQAVGMQTTLEVQITPALKLAGRVLMADAASDVAVLRVDAAAVSAIRAVPLGCGSPLPPLANGQDIVALDAATVGRVRETDGKVSRVTARAMIADLPLPRGAMGGPVFTIAGTAVGLSSLIGEKEGDARDESRVVRVDAVCDVVANAIAVLETSPPAPAHAAAGRAVDGDPRGHARGDDEGPCRQPGPVSGRVRGLRRGVADAAAPPRRPRVDGLRQLVADMSEPRRRCSCG